MIGSYLWVWHWAQPTVRPSQVVPVVVMRSIEEMEAVFERIDAALFVEHRVAMEAGGDLLALRGVGEHVAGELLDGELVERHVGVERVDHPIAVRPDRARAVLLVAVGVGVAGQIEPAARPALAVVRAGEQLIDELLVSIGRSVVDESIGLLGASAGGRSGRGRAGGRACSGRPAARDGALLASRLARTKLSMRIARPIGLPHRWQRRLLWRGKRPMRGVWGALGNPFFEEGFLGVGEHNMRRCGRHDHIGIG